VPRAQVAGELSPPTPPSQMVVAEVQNRVIDRCVQLFGGYGYMLEYDIAERGRCSRDKDLGRIERDHEGADRTVPRLSEASS